MDVSFEPFAELRGMPVNVTALHGSADAARSAPRGDVVLGFDREHALIRNVAFDPARLTYDDDYENSQFFSPTFRRFQEDLARRLVDRYDLRGKNVVEIGSGKGEFLTQLCEIGDSKGFGFDPSYSGQADDVAGDRVTFVVDSYDERYVDQPADLVACRHVIEHLDEPDALLSSLRKVLDGRPETVLYFEMPNAIDVLAGGGMWDIIYQHVWYFAAPALRWLFERHGFEVLEIGTTFNDSFLSIDARVGEGAGADLSGEVAEVAAHVDDFAERLDAKRRRWETRLAEAKEKGETVALWGAGARGVTFLNAVEGGDSVDVIIDVNPRKQGSFVPGTGQRITGPDDVPGGTVDLVLVMNPVYQDEIAGMAAERGWDAEVVVV